MKNKSMYRRCRRRTGRKGKWQRAIEECLFEKIRKMEDKKDREGRKNGRKKERPVKK